MPIYEYKCKNCGNCFEQIVFKSDDESKLTCSKCGKKDIEKIISSFSCLSSGGDTGISGCSSGSGFS